MGVTNAELTNILFKDFSYFGLRAGCKVVFWGDKKAPSADDRCVEQGSFP